MKRLLLLLAGVVLAALLLWLFGRAPTRYVLEQECRRYQQQRRIEAGELSLRIGRLEQARSEGQEPSAELGRLREQQRKLRTRYRRMQIRGWEILLIPSSAPRPQPGDFWVLGRFDPSSRLDGPFLRGEMEIWIRATGRLARCLEWTGLSP